MSGQPILNGTSDAIEEGWSPDLRSVTQCFDRMSFIRPVDFITRLFKIEKKLEKIIVPMELYIELICYLRLMVESSDSAHNDIALAALYKIFYIKQEREDPLPALFREWKTGTYGRKHLNGLATLAHEIMKTLDAARLRFREEARSEGLGEDDIGKGAKPKKIRKKSSVTDSERTVYLVAAAKFEPEEYLKRVLATNQAIKIYTSLLELYAVNTPAINYYVQCFMQRLCLLKLEDDYAEFAPAPKTPTTANTTDTVSLGFMFFNFTTLQAFNTLLQDPKAERDPNLLPLVRLIKQLVVQFGSLVNKNKLAFVETLFHPSGHSFLVKLESVYDAKSEALSSSRVDRSRSDDGASNSSSSESDHGEEFDEHGAYAATAEKPAENPESANKKRKEKRSKNRSDKKTSKSIWTGAEDKILREKYALYAGSYSAFDMIADDEELKYVSEVLFYSS